MKQSQNIVWHHGTVSSSQRAQLLNQQGCVLWFTGLSGSGKSTIARALEEKLITRQQAAYVLDGDNIRHGLNHDLDFSDEGRHENIRRIAEVATLFADAGLITITAFISPFIKDRNQARALVTSRFPEDQKTNRFLEVYINTPIEVCEARDPKGLYQKARLGEINNFTGIQSPYEAPVSPEIVVPTPNASVSDCTDSIIDTLIQKSIIAPI